MSHHDYNRKEDSFVGFIRRYWHLILTVMLAFSVLVSYRGKVDNVEKVLCELKDKHEACDRRVQQNQEQVAVIKSKIDGIRHDIDKMDTSIHELILVVKKNGHGR